jgi:hypothetical protein
MPACRQAGSKLLLLLTLKVLNINFTPLIFGNLLKGQDHL